MGPVTEAALDLEFCDELPDRAPVHVMAIARVPGPILPKPLPPRTDCPHFAPAVIMEGKEERRAGPARTGMKMQAERSLR